MTEVFVGCKALEMSIHFHIFVLSALAFVGHTFSFQLAPPSLSQITSRSASTKSSWSVLGPKAIGLDGRKSGEDGNADRPTLPSISAVYDISIFPNSYRIWKE